jgi:hypothetical protein
MALSERDREAIRRYAHALADQAPPLTAAQRDRLRALLRRERPERNTAAA